MSKSRISEYVDKVQDIDTLLERWREHHGLAESAAVPPVEDRVERSRASYLPDAPAHRVDLHGALTNNLRNNAWKPERIGHSKEGAGPIVVKAEARSDYGALPQ